MLRARALLVSLTLGLLAPTLPSEAQQAMKVPRLGLLSTSRSGESPVVEAFIQGLRELGYVEGQNILIERRFAQARLEQLPALAAELVRLGVDIIVTPDPPATHAARNETKTIPIVMRSSDDPVATGLAASLARPGGNITGVYSLFAELTPKRLEVLKDALPDVRRVAVLWNPDWSASVPRWRETEVAARSLGLQIQSLEVKHPEEFASVFRAATAERAGALITLRNPLIVSHRRQIVSLAAKSRLPAMYDDREFVEAGGLMSYGTNLSELVRRLATFADKILKGAKPADLPIEQPTKFELVINLKTAKALGLTIPQSVLFRADHVIQ